MIKFNNYIYKKKKIQLDQLKTLSYSGEYSNKCEIIFKKKFKFKNFFLTKSATAALETISYLINIKSGDEVIIPAYNYFSSANAFIMRGAKIVFCDINLDDLNISFDDLKKKITTKTKAIILMHYAGKSCEIPKFQKLCKEKKIFLIEDAAQCINSKLGKNFLGSFGDFGVLSFHESKNLSCGDGGAIIIKDKKYVKPAHQYLNKGTNRSDFLKGKSKKYDWVSLGSNSKIS